MSKTPVFLLVGHGSVSAKKTIIDVGNYNVILPVKIGDKLCLTAHNMIVYNLTSTNTPDELFYELKKLENLPSTTSVAKANTKLLDKNFNVNLGEHLVRERLEKLLQEAEMEALDSHKAWELLEHKISPALENLISNKAYIPSRFNKSYQEFQLLYSDFINKAKSGLPTATLAIFINCDKIKAQVEYLKANKLFNDKLSNDQTIYMMPYGINNEQPTLFLSEIIKLLPSTHIIIKQFKTGNIFTPEKTEVQCFCQDDYLNTNEWTQTYESFNKSYPDTAWYDLTIPDDSNLVLGACRDLDNSF